MVIDRQFSVIDSDTPEWVTESLFDNLLRKEVDDFLKILKFSTKHVNNCKENYLSVKIEMQSKDGKRRVIGFILKTERFSKTEKILPYLSRANLTQENFANFEILPKFRSLYDEEEKPIKFFPAAFKFPQTVPEEYVLFEDLQYKAFRTITGDLSSKQMEMVLDNLAAFHAVSVVGTKFNNVNKTSPASPNVDLQKLSNRIFHEHLRSYKLKCYEDKIKSLQTHYLGRRVFSNSQEFQVLLLGNCTLENMLFQIDAFGTIKDFVFINADMCTYGNPAKDLLYLLLSSLSITDKMTKFEYYIKYYHDQLVSNLKLLKFKGTVPKLSQLHYDLIKNNQWAFEAVTQVLPLTIWERSNLNESNDSDDDQTIDKLLKVMYAQENYSQQIQKLLPWMENKVFLDE